MTEANPSGLLTSTEVARIFPVTRNTVVSWADKGLLPHTRTPSGHLRSCRDAVECFRADQHRDARTPSEQTDA
jgi:DNA-binding transcriptional MerR regulator